MSATVRVIMLSLGFAAYMGCASSGVVWTESIDPMVKNGYVTDEARLFVDPEDKLRVPVGTVIERGEDTDRIIIKQRKELKQFDHPPEYVSIDDVRFKMGTIACRTDDAVDLASYGAVDIPGAGGRHISLTCIVPATMNVEFSDQITHPKKVDSIKPSAMDRGLNSLDNDKTWVVLQNYKSLQ